MYKRHILGTKGEDRKSKYCSKIPRKNRMSNTNKKL